MRINKEKAGLFPTGSLDLTRLFRRVGDRAKPPLAGCVNQEVVEQGGFLPTGT